MNRKTKPRLVKIILITTAAIVVVAGLLLGYMYYTKSGLFATSSQPTLINYGPATSEEIKAGEEIKQQTPETAGDKNPGTGSDPTPTPTPGENNAKSTVSVEITAANQSGNTVYIRTLIQSLASSGSCTLNITGSAGKTYSATAKTQTGPSTSTCMGFDVPVSALSAGIWSIAINYEDSVSKGSASKEITVN